MCQPISKTDDHNSPRHHPLSLALFFSCPFFHPHSSTASSLFIVKFAYYIATIVTNHHDVDAYYIFSIAQHSIASHSVALQ